MRSLTSVKALEDFGRRRLSQSFFMREFLHSEISQIESIPNVPTNVDLAVAAGSGLCEHVLEPLQERLGRLSIRSAYRSPAVNARGAANGNEYGCASNEANRARHIWDEKDESGVMGAMACVILTTYVSYFKDTRDWRALAWWIHDNISAYSELEFFTKSEVLAFNIGWRERNPLKTVHAWAPNRVCLTKPGMANHTGSHSYAYAAWRREA
jgi:hypothetical protein